ncbi:bifunctional UDP-N-acetylglucosamine pyrophosphorylase/glucosamine-1-phosphate N-acetyltransferase [Stackebrandtia endophytica]|uniref:Bifunctional protein GlmU n=1 Tax=Stackebrandtia endophytica TaxID=1496996 RepID=A0A543B079_9ACTN|nr:bifunctional UDP-N-acetylglucosamine diphosphorylase/glucosamine-1-phosphate N-acetyltransferase GlmU [Stackebrandtia endophytica]TQL78241.1 bifunctional UDP-N-acetylglucosamine pyrophosphorylase/glucosamine-1-phosphate N-acetyltransferase [Stackebrandtia endophytica]
MSTARSVVVLAAGMGTRMKSAHPKMLHPMLGRTLLGHVLFAADALAADDTLVVVGQAADQVTAHLDQIAPDARTVLQAEQRGTGHAVRTAMDAAPELSGTVVVLYGDTPLLRGETLEGLMSAHEASGAAATVLTAEVPDPTGLGRILRDHSGRVVGVVEQRDATPEQLAIKEINSGIYVFDAGLLRQMLSKLSTDNDQGEEYLTDVLGFLVEAGHPVHSFAADDALDTLGCNDRAQLAELRQIMQGRINTALMRSGVTMDDPATTWIDATVTVEPDVTIRPGVQLLGTTSVSTGAEVGPDSTLKDTVVGARAKVVRAHTDSATIGTAAQIGPFAYLRPGAAIGDTAKVGTYVEVKNSTLAEGSKVPHLSYVGDASIGAGANIGAGTIVANYDGVAKHHTEVGEAVFVGSNSVLVAPVTINDGSYVAAGSAINGEVPSNSLGVARGRQRNIEGWVERRRPGTKTAEAAERARQSE